MEYIIDVHEGVHGALRSPLVHGVLDIVQEAGHD